jgi:hypothetical protein
MRQSPEKGRFPVPREIHNSQDWETILESLKEVKEYIHLIKSDLDGSNDIIYHRELASSSASSNLRLFIKYKM